MILSFEEFRAKHASPWKDWGTSFNVLMNPSLQEIESTFTGARDMVGGVIHPKSKTFFAFDVSAGGHEGYLRRDPNIKKYNGGLLDFRWDLRNNRLTITVDPETDPFFKGWSDKDIEKAIKTIPTLKTLNMKGNIQWVE